MAYLKPRSLGEEIYEANPLPLSKQARHFSRLFLYFLHATILSRKLLILVNYSSHWPLVPQYHVLSLILNSTIILQIEMNTEKV